MKYIIALLILIPSVTFASWWNPTTWSLFQKEEVIQEEVREIVSEQVAPIQAVESETKTIIEYRTQVVTDNSSVASLQSQIVSLNQQIQILTDEKNSYYYHLNDCQNGEEEKDEWVSQIERNYNRIAEIETELNNYMLDNNMMYVPSEVEVPLRNEQAVLYAEINSLNLKLQVY